ncbi:MAG: serine hydrolase [Candidatus Thorarchaeota archaeon]|nr:serine hydrolase [Candidatus Thorarchaeota archaeon]
MTEIAELKGFDAELEKLRTHWDAPGIACVVLKDNEIAYSHAVGLRDIKKNLPMTPQTIQPIGSCSKSFTSTAVALLVEDGKLDWDTPIHKMFPKFELKEPIASAKTTLIDMLSHRTGLPRHDIVWLNDEFTYDMVFEYLPHLDLSRDFRTTFQYCNLMYIAAAALVEEISGMNYRDFLKKRIFKPLKLGANSTLQEMLKNDDHTKGYHDVAGVRTEVKYDAVSEAESIAATGAGSINAGTADLAKWLRFHLNKGNAEGKQLLSPENLKRTHIPVTMGGYSAIDQVIPGQKWIKQGAYALGWQTDVYRGFSRIMHGGNTEGSSTQLYFIPDEGIGVGVMVNEYGIPLTGVVASIIVDRLLKLDPVDWSDYFKPIFDARKKAYRESKEKEEELKVTDTKPTHPLEEYVGNYHNPGYGILTILSEEDELKLKYGSQKFPVTHYHYDTFQYNLERYDFGDTLTFFTESSGDIESLTIRLEMQVPPIKFARLPDDHLKDPAFLSKIEGKYEYYGKTVEMIIKGENTLVFAVVGAPQMELVPVRGMRFKPKASSSMTITFQQEENGEINRFMVSEFGTTVPGERIKS